MCAKALNGGREECYRPATFHHMLNVSSLLTGGIGVLSLVALAVGAYLNFMFGSGERTRTGDNWPYYFLVLWAVVPVAVAFVASFFRPIFVARYLIVILPALLLLAAAGLSLVRQQNIGKVLIATTVLISVVGLGEWYFGAEKDDWQATAAYIEARSNEDSGVIVTPNYSWRPLAFYLSDTAPAGDTPAAIYPAEEWGAFDELDSLDTIFAVNPAAQQSESDILDGYDLVWLVQRGENQIPAGLQDNLEAHFELAGTVSFDGIELLRYERDVG